MRWDRSTYEARRREASQHKTLMDSFTREVATLPTISPTQEAVRSLLIEIGHRTGVMRPLPPDATTLQTLLKEPAIAALAHDTAIPRISLPGFGTDGRSGPTTPPLP